MAMGGMLVKTRMRVAAERGGEYVSSREGVDVKRVWVRVRREAGRLGKMRALRYCGCDC